MKNIINLTPYLEHTSLKQGLTAFSARDNFELCSALKIPTLVIPPNFVKCVSSLKRHDDVSICTVIGFPLGYCTFETKLFEIENAIQNGADELDLVIDNSLIKEGRWSVLDNELSGFRKACGEKILKIIVETSLLSRNELERTAIMLIDNGIDYIKTSTGFVGGGAAIDDVLFLKENFDKKIRIKASGGIKTKEQALLFIKAGADKIGTSSTKQILDK
jgi:deoxyribose-phosphate aldolase